MMSGSVNGAVVSENYDGGILFAVGHYKIARRGTLIKVPLYVCSHVQMSMKYICNRDFYK